MDDEDTVDDDLMAQITRELAQLDDNSPLLEDDDHDPPPTVTELSVVPSDSKALEAFEVRLASQREAFDEQLEECAKLLQITQDKIDSSITVSLAELANEYAEAGEDEDTFRARIYAELEAADDSDDDVSDSSLDAEEGEEKTLAGERDRIGDSAEVMGDTPSLAIESALCSQTLVSDQSLAVTLFRENDLKALRRTARSRMAELEKHQQLITEQVTKDHEDLLRSLQAQEDGAEHERQRRHKLFEKEAEQVQQLAAQRETKLDEELKKSERELEDISQYFEAKIYKLEKQTEAEKGRLKADTESIAIRKQVKETTAATLIQSVYRGHRVRQRHGSALKRKVEKRLKEMHAERIEKASQRIQEVKQHQRLQVEKQLQEKAEKERRLEEAKQRELEEKLAKEEAKRIKMEKEAEEKRIAAEKRRREQELKEDEKRRKKEEKERIKREKEEERERIRKEKEEQKRLQQEQEEAEKIKRLEEEKERLFREEAKREELLRQREKKAELNADQQNSTASRLLLKQEKNQIETEKAGLEKCSAVNKAETEICLATSNTSEIKNESKSSLDKEKGEMRPTQVHNVMSTQVHNVMPTQVHNVISADEKASNRKCSTLSAISDSRLPTELPNAETSTLTTGKSVTKAPVTQNASLVEENAEKALKINEYKNWMEERKAKVAKANQKQAPSSLKQQEPIDPRVTEAKIEERRLRWIQECTPWSQVSGRALSNTGKARKSYKRPSSAAKHQKLIEEAVILREAGEESLLQVEAVQLTDLPGCRLSTLSRCKKLQALSVTRSGISAIDSLNSAASLVYTYFGGNAIDSIDLAVQSLVHLDLSSNNLTSMRGFDGCTNLKYLDISHNKISKLSNLSCIAFLHTLKAAHNQIISTKGLGECVTLQVVDLSSNHLTSIDEVGKLCLLRKLTASQNNIMEIPRLVNCVLLESLVLEDNSISSLDGLAYFWLPTLKEVNLTQNGVSAIQPLHGCFNLRTFNLSQNQLLDYKNVVDGLKLCINLEELLLNGNPLRNADISRKSICDALPQLKRLDGEECVNSESIELQSAVLNMANSAWIEHDNLERKYQSYLSDSLAKRIVSNAELLYAVRQLPTYYELSYRLAENVRYAHEFGSNSFETPHSSPTISSKELFQTKLASVENGSHVVTAASPSAKDLFEEKLKATLESTSLKVSADNIKLFKECNSPRPHSRHSKSKDQRTPSGVSTPRSARLRSSQMLSACNGETASTTHVPMRREMIDAAVKIQAVWRGYSFRQRLARALQQVKACSEESDEDIAEVDLSSFDFNVDDGWLPPDVPHLPQEHAILPRRSIQLKIDLDAASIPNGRVAAWLSPSEGFLESAANVDPPLSSMSGEISQRSKREEMIAQDWGFKDSHTAELMMKRAKKLKYNSQRKKKLDKLGPMGRYELQRKILQNIEPAKIIAPAKKTAPKKEYFKALEDAAERRTVAKSAEKTAAIERTYEWIHTQVGSRQPGENGREERISSGESQLPYMDKRLLDGGRTQLVQSPLEIMSVSSYNGPQSADSRDRGQSNSYSSKMTAHQRQVRKQAAVTAKNTGLEGFAAWGSGKKKNAR